MSNTHNYKDVELYYYLIEKHEDKAEVWNNLTGFSLDFCSLYITYLRQIYFEKKRRMSDNLYYYSLLHRVICKMEKLDSYGFRSSVGMTPPPNLMGDVEIDIYHLMNRMESNMGILDSLNNLKYIDIEYEFIGLISNDYYCHLKNMDEGDVLNYKRRIKLNKLIDERRKIDKD